MAELTINTINGLVVADTSRTRESIEAELQAAFPKLRLDPATPQGRLISFMVAREDSFARAAADNFNQLNAAVAGGSALRNLGAGRGVVPKTQVFGTAQILFTSAAISARITIPRGFKIATSDGREFQTSQAVTLGNTTSTPTIFTATAIVTCTTASTAGIPANQINKIISPIVGLATATNPSPGVAGVNPESDTAYRARILAEQARFSLGSYGAAVAYLADPQNIPGLSDSNVLANPTASDLTIQGVVVSPRSYFMCFLNGQNQDIANAISSIVGTDLFATENSSTGAATVQNSNNGNVPRAMTFYRGQPLQIAIVITILPNAPYNNLVTGIKDLCIAYLLKNQFLGGRFSGLELQSFLNETYPAAQFLSITINGQQSIALNGNQYPSYQLSDITVQNG